MAKYNEKLQPVIPAERIKDRVVLKRGILCFVAELKFFSRVLSKSLKTVIARSLFDAQQKRDSVEKNSSSFLVVTL